MPSREAFHIGPFEIGGLTIDIPVYWYGIMIMLGVIAASWISYREARRRGEDPEHVWQMFPWVLTAGIVGARLGFVLPNISRYLEDPIKIIAINEGGMSIQGAVIGGAVAVILYCNRSRISFFRWADIIVPGLALAQAIGRWGNYFNQEAFGEPTTLPWGIPISVQRQREVAGIEYGPDTRFHPTFAYEMIWDLINFGLLMWLGRQKRLKLVEGDLAWVYIVVYSVGRFLIEGLRVDSTTIGGENGIPVPQIVAVLSIMLAWGLFLYRHRPGSNAPLSETNLTEEERRRLHRERPRPIARSEQPLTTTGSRLRRVPTSIIGEAAADRTTPPSAAEASVESSQPS
jgi:phosphatidylglycerol---prolipoprotein diacylglyceryl transferase